MSYGSYTTFDFTKDSLWDYSFIPLIHENEFPELVKNKDFFSDLTKYKEQILNLQVPYNSSKIIKSLSPEEKKELLINFIRNYKVESYNSTAHCIFNNFINEINDNFIKDFFKVGIESGFILTYQLKDEYSLPYNKENKYKEINESSKSLDNDVVRKHHEVIAKELLRKKYKYKTGTIDKFVKINKDIIDNKEFIFSLDDEEYSGLIEELKEKNLNKTATVVMTIRLEHKLAHKNIKEKKRKI